MLLKVLPHLGDGRPSTPAEGICNIGTSDLYRYFNVRFTYNFFSLIFFLKKHLFIFSKAAVIGTNLIGSGIASSSLPKLYLGHPALRMAMVTGEWKAS